MNSRPRNPPEQVIEETLSALREVEPPTGLEERILRTLTQRSRNTTHSAAASHLYSSNRWPSSFLQGVFGPTGSHIGLAKPFAACALVLAFVAAAILHHSHPSVTLTKEHVPSQANVAMSVRATVPVDPATPHATGLHAIGLAAGPRMVSVSSRLQRRATPAHAGLHTIARASTDRRPGSTIPGVAAVAALTTQERLLQQIARSGDPSQIAMLNPEILARQRAQKDAEFRQFFTPQDTQNP